MYCASGKETLLPSQQVHFWYTQLNVFVNCSNRENMCQNFINNFSYNFLRANAQIIVQSIQDFMIREERDSFQIFALLNLNQTLMSAVGEPFIGIFGYDFGELVPAVYKKLPIPGRLELIVTYFPNWSRYYSKIKLSRTQESCMEISNHELVENKLSRKTKALETAESKIKALETALNDLETKIKLNSINCFEQEKTELNQKIATLENEIVKLTSEKNASEKDYKHQISASQSEQEKTLKVIHQQKKILENYNVKSEPCTDSKSQINTLESKIEEKQLIIASLLKKVDGLENKRTTGEREALDLQQQLSLEFTNILKIAKKKDEEIQKLKKEVELKSLELGKLCKINEDTFKEIEKNEKETEERCKEIVVLENKMRETESLVRKCNLANVQQHAKITELEGQLAFYENETKDKQTSETNTNTEKLKQPKHKQAWKINPLPQENPNGNEIKLLVKKIKIEK